MTQISTLSKYDVEDTKDVYTGQILRHLPVLTIITCHYQPYEAKSHSHTDSLIKYLQHLELLFINSVMTIQFNIFIVAVFPIPGSVQYIYLFLDISAPFSYRNFGYR